jgi:hypothetical protein
LDAPLGALQELHPDFQFQPANLLAQGGLRHTEPLSSVSEMELPSNCNKIAQMTQFHR